MSLSHTPVIVSDAPHHKQAYIRSGHRLYVGQSLASCTPFFMTAHSLQTALHTDEHSDFAPVVKQQRSCSDTGTDCEIQHWSDYVLCYTLLKYLQYYVIHKNTGVNVLTQSIRGKWPGTGLRTPSCLASFQSQTQSA